MKLYFNHNELFKKVNTLKNQHFLYWPISLQRITIVSTMVLIFTAFMQLFGTGEQQIAEHKDQIIALKQKIAMQEKTIQQSQERYKNIKTDTLLARSHSFNFSDFVSNFSALAKQEHIELLGIKPISAPDKREKAVDFAVNSFQVNATGQYNDLLKFMHRVAQMPDFAITDEFEMTTTPAEEVLSLNMIIDLYGQMDP